MGGGGGGGGSQTVEFNNPYESQIGSLVNQSLAASDKINAIGPYQGNFIAGADPLQQQALQQQQGLLANRQGFGANVTDLANRTIGGEFLDPNNPLLQGAIQSAVNPILEAQTRALQQAGLGASGAGAFSGNRLGLLQSDLAQQTQENIGDVAGRLSFGNLQAERDRQVQAANLLGQGLGLELLPSQLLGQVGEQQRGFSQDALQNALLQYQEQIEAPFRGINSAAGVLNTLGVQSTPGQTITADDGSSAAGGALQGALGGAAAGSVAGPWGALAGGILGAGASFL